ncbi:MAG TPA: SAM-dependent methyltransferase, partial [Jiangellaceae bacterium]
MAGTDESEIVSIPTDRPTSARAYGYMLGGKDNFEVDRQAILAQLPMFPESIDITRQNRQFLYRAVRYLAQEAGIRQFLDMGCGLPTDNNVHQVAQQFAPDARVVYVDIDPIVLTHGRALLGNTPNTTVITADMRDPQPILDHPEVERLIDFSEPLAVLYLSVVHHLTGADDPHSVLRTIIDRAVPGSYMVLSQIVSDDVERGAALGEFISSHGVPWQTRIPAEVDVFAEGLEPVEPGLGNVKDWRPDPDQPPLAPL